MKFICSRQDLSEALSSVSRAAADKSSIQALEGIKLSLEKNELTLIGYDLEIGIRTTIEVESEDSASVIVNSKLFLDIIRKMPSDRITFTMDESYAMKIQGGATEYSINLISASEYPSLPDFDSESSLTVPQPVLKAMINETIFAVSQSDIKPILKGELFEVTGGSLTMVAIDGFRLAIRQEPVMSECDLKFVVPARTLNEVSRMLKDDDSQLCKISVSKKQAVFDFSGFTVFSRLLEGEFHNYSGSIPKTAVTEVIIDRKELLSCLDRASLLVNEKIKSPVRCIFDNGCLKTFCKTQIGKISDEIKADITGPKMEIGFNCKYLSDPLKVIGEDSCRIMMNGGTLPMKIVPLEGERYTYLVLPVRLKD